MTDSPAHQPLQTRHLTVEQQFRAVGTIVGSAVGDALGAPFEFGPAGAYSRRFPQPVLGGNGEMVGGGGFDWAAGEFTDDTQMALALAESLLSAHGLDADDLWTRFRAWAHDANDIGINTRAVLSHRSHEGAAEKGHNACGGRSASNGCVMRIAPVGVLGVGLGRDETVRVAAAQAALTHFDPAAAAGAAIVAEIIRRVIVTGVFHGVPEKVVSELSAHPVLGGAVAAYEPLVSIDFDPVTFTGPGNGSVWTTVAQAVWAVRTTTSFEEAMVAVINLGGDTDTVAAVAGAVAGALYGMQRIPVRWVTYVHGTVRQPDGDLREYRTQDLIDVGRRLLGRSASSITPPEPPEGPRLVDPVGVHAANLEGAARAPKDHAVVTMCIPERRFLGHPDRRTVFMRDDEGDANTDLMFVVREAVEAIDAFLSGGREVVVHCHGGRSRTGLVLKAWYMAHHGVDHQTAHDWLDSNWGLYATYNRTFLEFLDNEWTTHLQNKTPRKEEPNK